MNTLTRARAVFSAKVLIRTAAWCYGAFLIAVIAPPAWGFTLTAALLALGIGGTLLRWAETLTMPWLFAAGVAFVTAMLALGRAG